MILKPAVKSQIKKVSASALQLPAQELYVNMIRLNRPEETRKISFGAEWYEGAFSVRLSELHAVSEPAENLPDWVYTNFKDSDESLDLPYNATFNPNTDTQPYRAWIMSRLHQFFDGLPDVLTSDTFTSQCEVWVPAEKCPGTSPLPEIAGFAAWKRFVLHTVYNREERKIYLTIGYSGVSYICIQPLSVSKGGSRAKRLRYQKKVISAHYADENGISQNELYPVLNSEMRTDRNMPYEKITVSNPPLDAKKHVDWFLDTYINSKSFVKELPVLIGNPGRHRFGKVRKQDIVQIHPKHLLAEFGGGRKSIGQGTYFQPFNQSGPFSRIPGRSVHVQLILPREDAQKLGVIRKEMVDRMSTLQQIHFEEKAEPVYYDSYTDAEQLVRKALFASMQQFGKPDLIVFVIPFNKDEVNPDKRSFYDSMKALYREMDLTSVFISRSFLYNTGYSYGTANLAPKICGRLGGIPWRAVTHEQAKEQPTLVVAVNAHVKQSTGMRYEAAVTMFREDNPRMQELFRSTETAGLLGSAICAAIEEWRKTCKKAGRIIVHVHPGLKKKDGLNDMLREIEKAGVRDKLDLYMVLLNANTHRAQFCINQKSPEGLPNPGTAVRMPDGSWLVHINRQKESADRLLKAGFASDTKKSKTVTDRYPFPLKAKIWKPSPHTGADGTGVKRMATAEEQAVLAHLIRMSVLSWSSVVPSVVPATVRYPKRLARLIANAPVDQLQPGIQTLFEGL